MLTKEKEIKLLEAFTIIYIAVFAILAVLQKSYEFLYYIIILVILMILTIRYYKTFHLAIPVLFCLSLLGLLHLLGGTIYIGGIRLYDLYLIKNFFRYDNLIHSFGIFISTFIGYNILKPHLDHSIKYSKFLLSLILILIALGIGGLNELIEFFATLTIPGAAVGVGDYFNNALDLFFNFIGATIAAFIIHEYHTKQLKSRRGAT